MHGGLLSRRAAALLLLVLAACDGGGGGVGTDAVTGFVQPPEPSPSLAGRGELVSATAGPRLPRTSVESDIAALGLAPAFTARHDAQPYVVRYRTPGVDGQLTVASGAVWIPVGAAGALPVVAYLHGTILSKSDAPSNMSDEGRLVGGGYASDGSLAVLPDYLGLGVAGAGTWHPYLHLRTHASATIDLLRAARALAQQQGVAVDWRTLFVTGYSQGGAAAMGTARELERSHAAELPLLGAAPMSGPYDLAGTSRRVLDENPAYAASVVYTLYLGESMRRVYQLAPSPSDLFASPHDGTAAALVEGSLTPTRLLALPDTPRETLRPATLRALLAEESHPLWRALRDNDAYEWAPRAPLRMYYGGADRDVHPSNATTAEARMRALGARDVAAVSVGASLGHGGAVVPAVRAGKLLVDSLRRTLAPAARPRSSRP
jgi:hypothetical protein